MGDQVRRLQSELLTQQELTRLLQTRTQSQEEELRAALLANANAGIITPKQPGAYHSPAKPRTAYEGTRIGSLLARTHDRPMTTTSYHSNAKPAYSAGAEAEARAVLQGQYQNYRVHHLSQ